MNTEIKVEFSIYNDVLNHQVITDIIGFQPTCFWNKGDEIRKNLFHQESAWIYSTGYLSSLYLEDIVDTLLQKLEINIVPLSKYLREYKLNSKFDIVIGIANNQSPSHCLSKKLFICAVN